MAKLRQDKALDNIEKGLVVLKGLGEAMGENLNQQDVLLTEIDSKMDIAHKGLKTNNMKLKGLVTQVYYHAQLPYISSCVHRLFAKSETMYLAPQRHLFLAADAQ